MLVVAPSSKSFFITIPCREKFVNHICHRVLSDEPSFQILVSYILKILKNLGLFFLIRCKIITLILFEDFIDVIQVALLHAVTFFQFLY